MSQTILPSDANAYPIPAVRLRDGGAHHVNVTNTAARNTNPFMEGTIIVAVYATVDIYIKFGKDNTVTATSSDHFYPAGVYYNFAINPTDKYVSVLRVGSTDGVFHLSENI